MKSKIRVNSLKLFLAGLIYLSFPSIACAQIPAIDSISLVKTIKQWFTQIQQSQTVINAMNTVQKTSAAIGTAKATVQEYVTKNKKKIEEAKKKIEQYKERAEEYKEEYQKYRQMAGTVASMGKEVLGDDPLPDGETPSGNETPPADETPSGNESQPNDETPSGNESQPNDETPSDNDTSPDGGTPPDEETPPADETPSGNESQPNGETPIVDGDTPFLEPNPELEFPNEPMPNRQPFAHNTDANHVIEIASSYNRQDNIAHAMALQLPDGGIDVNGTFIIPQILAMACNNMSANDAIEEDVLDECLVALNEERRKAQTDSDVNAPKVFNETMSAYAAASVAEAFKLINDADSFEEKFVEPVLYGSDTNKRDTYANIVEMAKGIDLQINSLLKMYSSQLVLKNIEDYNQFVFRNFTDEELKNVKVSSSAGKDDGTTSDGTFVIPKRMALTCGLDSESARDSEKMNECKDLLANIKEEEGFSIIRDDILHQMNKYYLERTLKVKSEAGDYKDIQEDTLSASFGGAEGSPATPEGDDGTDVRKLQEQLIKLSAQTAKNSIRMSEILSNAISLDEMHNFYLYDVPNRKKDTKS